MTRVAYLFPGQGSQKVGMGRSLAEACSAAQHAIELASHVAGFDVAELCFEGPDDRLRSTQNAQLALYVCSVAAVRCLQEHWQVQPFAAAGHSVGEYAALTAAGALEFEDGVRLVMRRGELMAEAAAANPGSMAAVLGLTAEVVTGICSEVRAAGGGVVVPANLNGAGQVVISGSAEAVANASERAKLQGARKILPLAVSGAFHSPLMVRAGDQLYATLAVTGFRKPACAVLSNVTAQPVETPADIIGGLTQQVSGTVRWEETMQWLVDREVNITIEFGSGEVLTNLAKRTVPGVQAIAVNSAATLQAAVQALQEQAA
ncbi:MAG: ACP S-malonyltransferase [Armatimonadetes bacterium]|nr:ACP S-malonyltransferase [Armatimonadota bacterium]MDE2205085.1 ACP S-malonyltransferase [Armatimonadota bacterium]